MAGAGYNQPGTDQMPLESTLETTMNGSSRISVLRCEHCGKVFISELAHRGHKANCPEREEPIEEAETAIEASADDSSA